MIFVLPFYVFNNVHFSFLKPKQLTFKASYFQRCPLRALATLKREALRTRLEPLSCIAMWQPLNNITIANLI